MKGGLNYWLGAFLKDLPRQVATRRATRGATRHVMFLICDHFEPRHAAKSLEQPFQRMVKWEHEYADFYARCVAEFGHGPRHGWFYPPHHGLEHLAAINRMVLRGLGEIELHLHHDNDTPDSLRRLLRNTLSDYHRRGLLLSGGADPKPSFAFIHGDWALCNSRPDGRYCGVNEELTILREMGCWGDFTMPSSEECQTSKINSIYYATDSPNRAKSHNAGIDLHVNGTQPDGSLFLMQGPLGINMGAPKYPRIENASVTSSNWGRPDRVRTWLNYHIHVRGRPEWTFVKLHTHGALEHDFDALFGERAWRMHTDLNRNYNDGKRFKLHYVTAREAYNICKAAEAGFSGDPSTYRDFLIPPYAHNYYHCSSLHRLGEASSQRVALLDIERSESPTTVYFAKNKVRNITGVFDALFYEEKSGKLILRGAKDVITINSSVKVTVAKGARLTAQDGQCIFQYESSDTDLEFHLETT